MKVIKSQLYGLLLYMCSALILLGPFLSTKLGIARVDTAIMPILLLFSISIILFSKFSKDIFIIVICLFFMFGFSLNSLILNFNIQNLFDFSYFYFLIPLFLFGLLYFQVDYLEKIRVFLFCIALIIILGCFIEFIFKVQLVTGNEELEIAEGAFKGFFFNTNDQAVIATSFSTLIGFFFILNEHNKKIKLIGYILLLLLCVVIFISASRAAILGYIAMLFLLLFLNAKTYIKYFYSFILLFFYSFIFNPVLLKPIFNFFSNFSPLERSVARLELVIFSFNEDNSISYRAEIYQKFIENFKILWFGFGPRNYEEYFNLYSLSYSLGYRNPHSFFIEMYLAFGIFSFIVMLILLLSSCWIVVKNKFLTLNQKVFFVFSVILFSWLVWIPSSILRLPLIWCLILFIVIYSTNHKRSHLKNLS